MPPKPTMTTSKVVVDSMPPAAKAAKKPVAPAPPPQVVIIKIHPLKGLCHEIIHFFKAYIINRYLMYIVHALIVFPIFRFLVDEKTNSVAEACTTQPNSKASSRVLYIYFSCMAG